MVQIVNLSYSLTILATFLLFTGSRNRIVTDSLLEYLESFLALKLLLECDLSNKKGNKSVLMYNAISYMTLYHLKSYTPIIYRF